MESKITDAHLSFPSGHASFSTLVINFLSHEAYFFKKNNYFLNPHSACCSSSYTSKPASAAGEIPWSTSSSPSCRRQRRPGHFTSAFQGTDGFPEKNTVKFIYSNLNFQRVSDYHHNPGDVVGGMVLGAGVCVFVVVVVLKMFSR